MKLAALILPFLLLPISALANNADDYYLIAEMCSDSQQRTIWLAKGNRTQNYIVKIFTPNSKELPLFDEVTQIEKKTSKNGIDVTVFHAKELTIALAERGPFQDASGSLRERSANGAVAIMCETTSLLGLILGRDL